jgi:hypothetical protein
VSGVGNPAESSTTLSSSWRVLGSGFWNDVAVERCRLVGLCVRRWKSGGEFNDFVVVEGPQVFALA